MTKLKGNGQSSFSNLKTLKLQSRGDRAEAGRLLSWLVEILLFCFLMMAYMDGRYERCDSERFLDLN